MLASQWALIITSRSSQECGLSILEVSSIPGLLMYISFFPPSQTVVASIACDPNVWNAVLQNPALQEFLESQKTSEKCASSTESDQEIDESIADTYSLFQPSPRIAFAGSKEEESKSGNSFTDFLQNVKQTVTRTMVDMMNSLSDYFNNLFGGNKVFLDADGSAKLGAVEKTGGASFMALVIMVMMVVVSKRSQS